MHVGGSMVVEVARRPGAAALTLAGDLAAYVLGRSWGLVRSGATAARRRVPVWTPAVAQLVPAGSLVVESPRLVTTGPSAPVGRSAPAHHEIVLPADPVAPGRGRALLQSAVQEWGLPEDLHDDAAMVVTELVANAVDHARTPSTLTLGLDDRGLRVAVRDGHRGPVPRPQPVDPTAPRGRGLQMVAALAGSWGVTTHLDGKTVWAVLPRR